MTAAARRALSTSRATLSDVTFDPPRDTERGASPVQSDVRNRYRYVHRGQEHLQAFLKLRSCCCLAVQKAVITPTGNMRF